jgi:hypothetical protein
VLAHPVEPVSIVGGMRDENSIEPELKRLLTKLVSEMTHDRTEVELRQKRIAKNEELLKAVKNSLGALHPEQRATAYGSQSEAIKNAIGSIPTLRFTQNDVESQLASSNPEIDRNRDRIRSVLWSISKDGTLIRQVSKGNNRRLAEYEKVAPTSNGVAYPNKSTEATRTARGLATSTGVITVVELENFVRQKARRIHQISDHFKVDDATVLNFLEPASKVYRADKGWIKLHE